MERKTWEKKEKKLMEGSPDLILIHVFNWLCYCPIFIFLLNCKWKTHKKLL